jgi:hypothetical protein
MLRAQSDHKRRVDRAGSQNKTGETGQIFYTVDISFEKSAGSYAQTRQRTAI